MNVGFDTIGNAILICYDQFAFLVNDTLSPESLSRSGNSRTR